MNSRTGSSARCPPRRRRPARRPGQRLGLVEMKVSTPARGERPECEDGGSGTHRSLHERSYELELSPRDAVLVFQEHPAVLELRQGHVRTAGGSVTGWAEVQEGRVVLCGRWSRGFPVCSPLTSRIELELAAAAQGASITLRRQSPSLRAIRESKGIVAVPILTVLATLWIGVVPPITLLYIFAAQLLAVGVVWTLKRRGAARANDALLDLAWRVWAPHVRLSGPGPYRG